jgi:microsomal prostaglandin-E synthase 2
MPKTKSETNTSIQTNKATTSRKTKVSTKTTTGTRPKKPVTLYQYSTCPFAWKVKSFLEHNEIAYKSVEVNPITKAEISFSEYKKVPIVIDANGKQLNDSDYIISELSKQYKKSSKPTSKEVEWTTWANDILVKSIPPLIYGTLSKSFKTFGHITTQSNFSFLQKMYIRLGGTVAMYFVANKRKKQQGITDAKNHMRNLLRKIEDSLTTTEYLTGKKVNNCDLIVFGYLKSLSPYTDFELVRENTTVMKWFSKLNKHLFND